MRKNKQIEIEVVRLKPKRAMTPEILSSCPQFNKNSVDNLQSLKFTCMEPYKLSRQYNIMDKELLRQRLIFKQNKSKKTSLEKMSDFLSSKCLKMRKLKS